MSEPSANESESADSPSGSGRGSSLWWLVAVTTPVLYVLSIGPAAWLWKHGYLGEWIGMIYMPLDRLPVPTVFAELIREYVELWVN